MSRSSRGCISHFFRKKSQDDKKDKINFDKDVSKTNAPVKRNLDELWENPIGLTTSTAIEIITSGESSSNDSFKVPIHDEKPRSGLSISFSDSQNSANGAKSVCSNSESTHDKVEETALSSISTKQCKTSNLDKKGSEHIDTDRSTCFVKNPFQQFAFGLGQAEASYFNASHGRVILNDDSYTDNDSTKATVLLDPSSNLSVDTDQSQQVHIRLNPASIKELIGTKTVQETTKKKRRKISCKTNDDTKAFVSIHDLSMEEKIKMKEKWHSYADPNADIETHRFQVLIAARLHTQSHDKIVLEAMLKLRTHFGSYDENCCKIENIQTPSIQPNGCQMKQGELCIETLSKADPEVIAKIISSVLFANSKSRQIIQAAKDIKSRFGGHIPESKHGLNEITGIGPRLSDLLSYVIKYSHYKKKETH